jgi:uncharacterized protein
MADCASNPLVDSELAARFALDVMELWPGSPAPAQIDAAARRAFQWAEYCLDLLATASPEPQPPACQAGCDCCCYNQVELTAPEALALGSFLAERLPPPTLQSLLARVEWFCGRQTGKTKVQLAARRAEMPCPLLENGRCLAYEARPLMCRAMHSLNVEACRRELADPNLSAVEFYLHRHIIHVSLSQGLVDACRAQGYQPGPVELAQAVRHYFAQPELARHWLAGEAVFQTTCR